MAISPLGPAGAGTVTSALGGLPALPSLPAPVDGTATAADGGDFGNLLTGALEQLSAVQARSDRLAIDAATGTLADVHDYMIAAAEASLATELTVAVRNRALEAFNQIMSMGV